jgi:hypothetical protein
MIYSRPRAHTESEVCASPLHLPDRILLQIISYLSAYTDLLNLRFVSKRMRSLMSFLPLRLEVSRGTGKNASDTEFARLLNLFPGLGSLCLENARNVSDALLSEVIISAILRHLHVLIADRLLGY